MTPKKKKAPKKDQQDEAATEATGTEAEAPRGRCRRSRKRELSIAVSSVVVDAVEHLVRGIVDNPDDVRVDMVTSRRGRTVEVQCTPMTWARSSGAAAARPLRCGPWSQASVGAVFASTWWTPTSSVGFMDLVVGRVVKAHGITGELVVEVRTDDPDARFFPGVALRGRAKGGPSVIFRLSRCVITRVGC